LEKLLQQRRRTVWLFLKHHWFRSLMRPPRQYVCSTNSRQCLLRKSDLQMVGNLMHVIVKTKSNCSIVVSSLAQYLSNLAITHIHALSQIIYFISKV
jgi:hypothetical protein